MKFRTFHLGICISNVVCTRAGILLRPKFNQTNTKQNIVLLGCTVVHVTMWSKCTYLWFTLLQLSDQFHYSNVRWVSWHFTSHDWQLDCLLNSLISLIKKRSKIHFTTPFVRGIYWSLVDSPHKGPAIHIMTSSCVSQTMTQGPAPCCYLSFTLL